MNTLLTAWRNLWRNTRRTVITLTAVGLNMAVLIASYALMDGLLFHTVQNAVNLDTGEVQVHAPDYLSDRSMYKDIDEPGRILNQLHEQGVPAAPRSYGYGLAASGTKSAGAMFWGVDPAAEKRVFELAGHVKRGVFLDEEPSKGVVLGRKLARSLNVDVGGEVVVVVQAADGSLGNELYTVTGILKAAGESIDRSAAILHRAEFNALFVAGGRVHEIAVNTGGSLELARLKRLVEQVAPHNEVATWRELLPALSDMVNLFDVSIWIFGSIFFLAAGLGVMNTMLMATFERMHEFGLVKALGASPWRIVRDVAAEALVLSLAATALGALLGLSVSWYLQGVGLDTSRFVAEGYSLAGVAFDPVWRAVISVKGTLLPVVAMWAVCVAAALYPASIAARLDPVEAMTKI